MLLALYKLLGLGTTAAVGAVPLNTHGWVFKRGERYALQPNIYGQTGDRTQASWIYTRCSTTELPSLGEPHLDCLSFLLVPCHK